MGESSAALLASRVAGFVSMFNGIYLNSELWVPEGEGSTANNA